MRTGTVCNGDPPSPTAQARVEAKYSSLAFAPIPAEMIDSNDSWMTGKEVRDVTRRTIRTLGVRRLREWSFRVVFVTLKRLTARAASLVVALPPCDCRKTQKLEGFCSNS